MNIVFLGYFILIVSLSFLRKYKWSIVIVLPAVIHVYCFSAKISLLIHPFTSIIFYIFIYSSSMFLIYRYQIQKREDLEGIKIAYQNEEGKLKQLSTQEKILSERNKHLERSLNETATIYEYVKKLGSTLEFEEAIKVLQETLKLLIEFGQGKLFLIVNSNIEKVYDLKGQKEVQPLKIKEFEKNLLDTMIKSTKTIFYDKGKLSPIGQLPPDIHTLVAIPLVAERQLVSILTLENLPLTNVDRIQFIAMQFALEVKKTQLYQKVKELSIIDSLTGLYLRRHFQKLLDNELDRCHRKAEPLSFLMIDIDWFKRYNDEYGHLVGDLILKTVGSILRQKSREIDLLCRYGGDEFALVLPRTGSPQAQLVAERVRRGINESLFHVAKEEFQVAVSIGVATCLPKDMREPDTAEQYPQGISAKLMDIADNAMYQAKSQGRNRVVMSLNVQ